MNGNGRLGTITPQAIRHALRGHSQTMGRIEDLQRAGNSCELMKVLQHEYSPETKTLWLSCIEHVEQAALDNTTVKQTSTRAFVDPAI